MISNRKVFRELKRLLETHKPCLTTKELDYVTRYDWKTSNFYVQPKINKCQVLKEIIHLSNSDYIDTDAPESLKGRPIVAGPLSPTKHLAQLIDRILSPIVSQQKSYIKDDWDFIGKLPREVEVDSDLFSCDVVSLYTSIPHTLGLRAIQYWIERERHLIPTRFTNSFILDCISFILNNNNFSFDSKFFHQLDGTGMGNDMAANYACLTMGYQEEAILFPIELPRYFNNTDINRIQTAYNRFMDDGFLIWPRHLDINIFIAILNNLHPNIKYTIEMGKCTGDKQELVMLDILVILHSKKRIETEIHYKETNTFRYLDYYSHHPEHIKQNIPYNLAKRIIVFTSDPQKEKSHLEQMYNHLVNCRYPKDLVKKGFHNAKLQGPAPNPANKKKIIPLVTTYYSNLSNKNIVQQANFMLQSSSNDRVKEVFNNHQIILSLKQPANLLRQLSKSQFESITPGKTENGIFRCSDKRCKLCRLYIKPCKSFNTINGFEWVVRSHITCQSKNILYYLKCLACNGRTTYTGKSNNTRNRMNCHISESKSGNTSDRFDTHVHKCMQQNNYYDEPLFEIFMFMSLKHEYQLITYENYLHNRGFDTINAPK